MRRTGRSPQFHQLLDTFQAARLGLRGSGAVPRVGISRRQFMAGAAAGLMATYSRTARARTNGPSIAVVGAGIAGLNATYLLAKAGFEVVLYEASARIGGRILTDHGSVARNVYTELGGEFIDSDHADMLGLAAHFQLGLIDTQAPSESKLKVAYYAEGKLRSEAEVIAAFKPLAAIVDADYAKLSDTITYNSHSAFDASLDNTDLNTYLQKNVKTDWLREILEAAYVNEFGLDLVDQSSLNFILTIGTDTSNGFEIYGASDQRYKINGGNQRVVDALANAVEKHIALEHKLSELKLLPNGEYQLRFEKPKGADSLITADIVVLCLPFTILRNIDMDVPLPAIKTKAIQELGYGTNGKLILGFKARSWRSAGYGGDSYADLPFQSGWDSSREQGGVLGAYTIYPGGTKATDLAPGTDLEQAHRLLPGLNQVFPGVQRQWLGTALRAYWPSNPHVLASYAAYTPGQWTGIRGAEGASVGNLHFAGEHTSLDWQGYMNGGAESGRLVAEALIG